MSRSSKKKQKQKQKIIIISVSVVIALTAISLFLFKDKIFGPLKPSSQNSEIIGVDVNPGDGALDNKSEGDVNKDNNHEIPHYMDQYLNGDKESPILKDEENKEDSTEKKTDKIEESDSTTKEEPTTSSNVSSKDNEGYLEIHFIDVGQGDSILLKFVDTNLSNGDDSASMLVDAGDTSKGTTVRNYLKNQKVDGLTYLVCTHPDSDHIGGAASVVSNLSISSEVVWAPNFEKTTKVYENLMNEIFYKSYKYEEPKYGEVYKLGQASFEFVAPTEKHTDVNSNSLVFKIWYGEDSFLLVGDCEEEEELEIINGTYKNKIDADVLKVGHHGSKTASSKEFLDLVTPEYAVISCGEGNKYFHPHAGALNNLRAIGAELFRTDVQGSIVATTKGNGISWNASPCNDWSAGE